MERDYDIMTQIHIDLNELKNDMDVFPHNFTDDFIDNFDLLRTQLIKEAFLKVRRLYS